MFRERLGESARARDLDGLVEFAQEPGLFEFINCENYLSARLGVKVDLVMKETLKPRIGRRILREVKGPMKKSREFLD